MENLTGGTPPVRYLPCVDPCKLYFPFIKNNGSENSGQITLMRSLDILLPETHLQYESINGDSADGASFFPVYRELNTGDSISVCAYTGRPSEGIFPVFALRYGTVKQLFAIGWAVRWSYEIHVTEKGTRITAGIPQEDFYLKPGEEVRMPSVICITGTGEEVYARFRSFLKKKTDSFSHGLIRQYLRNYGVIPIKGVTPFPLFKRISPLFSVLLFPLYQ